MRLARLYVTATLVPGQAVTLPEKSAHYLRRVLRLRVGDALTVFGGGDTEHPAIVQTLASRSATVVPGEPHYPGMESPLDTWLVQGLCRGRRMDYCVQKATEMGVNRIVPLVSERVVVHLGAARVDARLEHWRGIASGAAEQSGRTRVPAIDPPLALADFLAGHAAHDLVLLDFVGEHSDGWQAPDGPLILLAGPEGGFSDAEREEILAAGAASWRLGPRIFRTETAGVVALAIAQSRFGDLRTPPG